MPNEIRGSIQPTATAAVALITAACPQGCNYHCLGSRKRQRRRTTDQRVFFRRRKIFDEAAIVVVSLLLLNLLVLLLLIVLVPLLSSLLVLVRVLRLLWRLESCVAKHFWLLEIQELITTLRIRE